MSRVHKKIPVIHPGEVLREEFLLPLKISQYRIAKDIGVPPRRINEIVQKKRAISADTALRLAKYFNTSPQFWTHLQSLHDLSLAEYRILSELSHRIKVCAACSA